MPGPVFVTTTTQPRHGVFAIEQVSPAVIVPTGSDVACELGQFAWGPANVLTTPVSIKDLTNTVAPPGVDHANSAYLGLIRKGWPTIKFVRVVASTAVVATANLPNAVPTQIVRVDLKYPGIAGNSMTWTVSSASDGNALHFKLTVTATGPSGTTTDVVDNLNYSGTGADSIPVLTNALLIGAITKLVNGTPIAGTGSFASGTTPAVISSDYVGTQGNGDKGTALLEGDSTIRHFFYDDMGSSLRAAVNAGGQAHAVYMGDRVAYLNGIAGQTLAAVATDVANYRSDRVMYLDPWVNILDDVNGTKRLVPSASFAASVAARLSVSTSIAWKGAEVQQMLAGINSLEADRGQGAGSNTSNGAATFIKETSGGFTIEADVMTQFPVDVTHGYLTRRRVTDFIAISFVSSTRGFVDAPNVPDNQQNIVNALEIFMKAMKRAKDQDPNHNPHVVDYQIGNLNAANTQADIQNGKFSIPLDVTDSAGMRQIFLGINSGESVVVTHT
ncbi:MAG TPA: hypothetical protein VFT22_10870 [Kofleriaceae bacterium]|nr:hypothetical protein [Kofleriaceae bacterium]